MKLGNVSPRVWIVLITLILGGMLLAFSIHSFQKARRGNVSDFEAYYTAATALCEHQDPYVFSEKPYIYPPLLATLLMPFTVLSMTTAAMFYIPVMGIAIVLAFIMGTREFIDRFDFPRNPLHSALSLFFAFVIMEDRIKADLQMFQVNSLLLFLLVLALRLLDKRPFLAGASLGLAMNIKAFPVIMFPYLLVRRRYRAAASMLAATLCFGLAPAIVIGWTKNLQYLSQSSAGFLSLLGIQTGIDHKAQILGVTASYSVSLPSGITRMAGPDHIFLGWFFITVLLTTLGVLGACLYRRNNLPLLRWPDAEAQQEQPWRALIAKEWVILVTISLIFSPQTNSRHLLMLAMMAMFATVVIVHVFRQAGWDRILAGAVLLWIGLTLPPGSFKIPALMAAHQFWQYIGGPSWILLISLFPLEWGGITVAQNVRVRIRGVMSMWPDVASSIQSQLRR